MVIVLPRSGIIGERLPIRLYLTVGMLTSGLFTCLFGLGYVYNIHSLGFYIFVQVRLNIMYYKTMSIKASTHDETLMKIDGASVHI